MAISINVKFATNVDELKAALLSGTDQINAMKQSVDRTAASLGGEGLFRAANNATAAVEQLGGATRLTTAEKERLNQTLTKAIEKYEVMGRTAPTAMKDLAAATKSAGEATHGSVLEFLEGIPLVEGFIAAFTVERIVEFGLDVIESAARLNVLSHATGITVEGIQQLRYVGQEFGVDVEQMARGVEQFSRRLASGDAGATSAVQSLGLSVKDLIAAGPKDAFVAFADAVGKVEDPMQRARLASEAFGSKLGLTLLPALSDIKPKMEEAARSGTIMADETAENAHKLEVAWERAKLKFQAFIADLLLKPRSTQDQFEGLEGGGAFQMPAATTPPPVPDQDPAAYDKWLKSVIVSPDAISNAQLIQNELKALRTQALEPLSAAQQKQILELKEWGKGEEFIAQRIGSNVIAVHRYLEAHHQVAEAEKKSAEAAKKFAESVEAERIGNEGLAGVLDEVDGSTVEAIKYALIHGDTVANLAREYGIASEQVEILKKETEAETKADKDAIKAKEDLAKELEKIEGAKNAYTLKGFDQLNQTEAKANEQRMKDSLHALTEIQKLEDSYFDHLAKASLSSTDYQIFQIHRRVAAELAAIPKDLDPAVRDRLVGGIRATEHLDVEAVKYQAHAAAVDRLAQAFLDLGRTVNGTVGAIIGGIGAIIQNLQQAAQIQKQTGSPWGIAAGISEHYTRPDGTIGTRSGMDRIGAGVQMAGAVYQGAQNVWAATESHRTAMGNALGGGMAGAQAGSQFGIYGTIIGFVGGFVVGLIRGKPEWAKIADDIGRDFGTKISDALAKQIQADSKKLGKEQALYALEQAKASGDPEAIRKATMGLMHHHADHQAAGIQNIGGIISEAGGLTAANLGTFEAKLRDVFVMLAEHRFTAAEATKVLNDNFAQFAQAGTDKLGFLDAKMIEMIQLTHQAGLEVQAITEYEQAQISKAMEGINAIVAGTEDARKGYGAVKKGVDDATEALKALTDKGTTSGKAFDEATAALKKSVDTQQTTAAGAKQELADLGLVAVASFNAAIKAGMTFAEALAKLHPTLETLRKDFKDLGLDPDDPLLKTLFIMDAVATKAAALVNAAAALPGVLTGMANIGEMNPERFAAMERTGYTNYVRIQDKVAQEGGGEKEALQFMQPWLHAAEKYAHDNNIALDNNTQMMIDHSKADGIWKEAEKTENEKLMESIAKLKGSIDANTVALGGTAPSDQAGEKKPGENGHAGGGTGDSTKTGGGNAPPITDGSKDPAHRLPYHPHDPVVHTGGFVGMGRILRFHGGGLASDEVPAILQTGEAVLSRRAVAALGVATVQALNTGGASAASAAPSGGTSTSTVHLTMHVHLPTGAAADPDQFAQVALDTLRRDVRGFRTAVENVAKQAAA